MSALKSFTPITLLSVWFLCIEASAHHYAGERFVSRAMLEGTYSSLPNYNDCARRYGYSEDGSEEFDKDDTLRFIKPSPMPSKDVQNPPEVRSYGSNGASNGDLEEDKTE
ncbi:hypothetical protein F0562_022767 [Nyssa sinensis]|uniref:Uncharacterized protein n=1 Tax=Nyssa sinensis TaxID=561372 RepID=A0A5J5BEL8_9ASTE|nr:hypothetical protein F0562_022767 [Nyssa sinensis]